MGMCLWVHMNTGESYLEQTVAICEWEGWRYNAHSYTVHAHRAFVWMATLFSYYLNYTTALTEWSKCSKCRWVCLDPFFIFIFFHSRITARISKQNPQKGPGLVKTNVYLSDWKHIRQELCKWARSVPQSTLPDAGECSPTGGSKGRAQRYRQDGKAEGEVFTCGV